MSDGVLVAELRRSVSLLPSEGWVLGGALAGGLSTTVWVLGTALVVGGAAGRPVAVVNGVSVSLRSVLALVLWVVVPGIAVATLARRRFRNDHGNLHSRYRLDHPSLLLVVPGLAMLGCLAASVTRGPSAALTAVALVAGSHLLVRTVAYGYRVYTLSMPRFLDLLLAVGGAALAAVGLLALGGTGLGLPAGERVAAVVDVWLAVAGVGPVTALAALVSVPPLVATAYLAVQLAAATVVRLRAPLANPSRRPGQRFPVMPPVSHGEPTEGPAEGEGEGGEPSSTSDTTEPPAEATDAPPDDAHSQTQVFTPDDATGSAPPAATDVDGVSADGDAESGWEDDTAVFSLDRGTDAETCGACGEAVTDESVSFCPNCGEELA